MRVQVLRLGFIILTVASTLSYFGATVQAQDQSTLATSANAGMQEMSARLTATLQASSETAARAEVNAAIAAGNSAVTALQSLSNLATDDVVRSRSEAARDQTQDAVNKAQSALSQTGDAFRASVSAALAEINEAIAEFAPVLSRVPAAAQGAPGLPKAGVGDLSPTNLIALGLAALGLLTFGASLRLRIARV